MLATVQSLLGDKELHERFLGRAEEDNEDGKSQPANLGPTWKVARDGRLRGGQSSVSCSSSTEECAMPSCDPLCLLGRIFQ